MFEILALDQAKVIAFYTAVFGWEVERDAAGYAYIRFPPATYPPSRRDRPSETGP